MGNCVKAILAALRALDKAAFARQKTASRLKGVDQLLAAG
jgi:hypothetical protein